MKIRLDPWAVSTLDRQLTLRAFGGETYFVEDIEQSEWKAIAPQPIPSYLQEVYVIDGCLRTDARLFIEQNEFQGMASLANYAVGAVQLCPHQGQLAQIAHAQLERIFLYDEQLALIQHPDAQFQLDASYPYLGQLGYRAVRYDAERILPEVALLQRMREAEHKLAKQLSTALPSSEEDDASDMRVTRLVLQDGPVSVAASDQAILGCVKTLKTDYLGAERSPLLEQLKVGERTPIIRFQISSQAKERDEVQQRFSWYIRLLQAQPYEHDSAGVLRVEMHAPEDVSFVPMAVQEIANYSGTLLTLLGSMPHKDDRAPQNLIPTAALERHLRRQFGDQTMLMRRIRQHMMQAIAKE